MLRTFIFDLDGTTVNSAHRQGETLDEWRAMNTPANIMRDSTLPLAEQMRQAILDGLDVVICTSRVMSHADRVWLNIRGLIAPTIISRDAGDDRHAGEYKLARLQELARARGMSWGAFASTVVLWDDDLDVQETLGNAGVRVVDPVQYNSFKTKALKEAI